ncbi:MAG: glycoside hydrolase family 3 C-terminal domain-containing protein, partial [Clostridia bacterium]|nr:glycoside hydrolase family 3 C-terminal domain-containing protein [Clostridia bacterium]
MKKLFSIKLWRRLLVAMVSVLVIVVAVTSIANSQAPALNNFFDCKTFKIVKGDDTDEDTEYFKSAFSSQDELQEFEDSVCREVESEGIVLMRNDNDALPLDSGSSISLFGQGSASFNYGASGSSANADSTKFPTLKEALSDFKVNGTLWDMYSTGAASKYRRNQVNLVYQINEAPWSVVYTDAVKNSLSSFGDAAIYVISRDSGEGQDISTTGSDGLDGSYLSISAEEKEVLQNITSLKKSGTFKKTIVILNSAVPIQLDFLYDSSIDIDAVLWVGDVGSTGMYAINDVLCGKVNPSGKLSDTYCKDNFSSPAMANWAANPDKKFSQEYTNASQYYESDDSRAVYGMYGVYAEGIYVGYRYYETRYADYVMGSEGAGNYSYDDDVAYPFGYGLSYADFLYSNAALEEKDDEFIYSVDVMNISDEYSGKAVVEVYLQKPYTDYDRQYGVETAAVELVGFEKTDELEPLDSVRVSVTIDKSELRKYDSSNAKTYIMDGGDYYFSCGDSAHDALNNILSASGYSVSGSCDASLAKSWNNPSLDTESFAYASETGNKISNEFDFCDMDSYDGAGDNSVTYVSRSDWTGTWPDTAVSFTITETMADDISSNKEIVEDGSEMPAYGADNGLSLVMLRSTDENPIAYDDDAWDDLLDELTYGDMAYLMTNGQYTTVELGAPVNKPATKDNDGPNGIMNTTTNTSFPSEGIWASSYNKDLIKEVGEALAEDTLAAGYTGLYGPGV